MTAERVQGAGGPGWQPLEIDIHRAHPARMYDYYLGGTTNFDADREAAERALTAFPTLTVTARENRAFLLRAVDHLSRLGLRQFIDIGTGIPIEGRNTHDAAQAVNPSARVVYVDNDPIVLTHARALLTSHPEGRTAYIDADLRDPVAITGHPALDGTLDFDEPIALLLIAVLHFVPDEYDPLGLLRHLTARLPAGSHVVISHVTADYDPRAETLVRTYREAGIPAQTRTHAEVEALFTGSGLELAAPGVRMVSDWRVEPGRTVPDPATVSCYGAAGVKTGRP